MRPRSSLGGMAPAEFTNRPTKGTKSLKLALVCC